MEDQFLEGLSSLERQAFVNYVAIVDKNGFSIASRGDANKVIASYIREVQNCVEGLFPENPNTKIIIEGSQKSVVIGHQNDFLVGVQITKDMF